MHLERLEDRMLLCANLDDGNPLSSDFSSHGEFGTYPVTTDEIWDQNPMAETSPAGPAASSPLTSLPQLHSNPTATAKLFLDFDGHFESSWGGKSNALTPAYDQDGDTSTFSDGELASINEIWARVAEDYAPFKIDVTTVDPGNQADRVVAVVAIGGSYSDWYGNSAGGVAYIGGFSNLAPNVAYVFENNLSSNPKYVAEASSHEAGHLFNLLHQSVWSGSTLVNEYNPGNGLWGPVMGNSYSDTRTTWYNGTSSSGPTAYQDDMAIIAGSINGFGYKPDDYGSTLGTASLLPVSGTSVNFNGLIGQNGDQDVWSFSTSGGTVTAQLSGAPYGTNLDAVLELWNSSGGVIVNSNPSNSLGASLSTTIGAGTYYLVGRSLGDYGDVGQYTITGSLPAALQVPEINLSVAGVSIADGGTLAFGSTTQGTSVSKTVTVTNTGSSTLTLTALNAASMPAGFTLVSNLGSTSLAAGQATTFTVRLDAATAGTFSGAIQLANNDSDENPYDLTLQGTVTSTSASGPVALYHFDETSGTTAADSSGSGNNATYVNSPTLGQTGALPSGSAINLSGSNQYVSLPSAPFGNYSGSNYALSFETWFNAPAGASGVILSQAGAGSTPGGGAPAGWVPAMHLGTDGKLRASLFWHGDTGARLVSPGATAYNDGNWHHVAVTYANGVETLYIDGAQVGQQAAGEVAYATAYNYYLGTGYTFNWTGGNGGWHYFKGKLDEAAIYQRALSGAEIAQAYAAATTVPEITVRVGSTTLTDGQTVDFGSTPQGSPITQTFTVANDGTATLTLTALNAASMPAGFTLVSNLASTSLAVGQSTTFTIRLDAAAAGSFSGAIQLANNDSDENPYDLALTGTVQAPEISLSVGGVSIADGGTLDFGSTAVGTTVSKTVTVTNTGSSTLTLTALNAASMPAGFTLVSNLGSTSLAAGQSTTFTIRLDAAASGSFSGGIQLANNDSDENPYDVTLTGTVQAPEIDLSVSGVSIADGGTLALGSTPLGTAVSKTVTVTNLGSSTLTLTALNAANMPAGFTLVSNLGSTSLAAGQSTTFTVRLDAAAAGSFSGAIQLANSDSDENPYDLTLEGTVTSVGAGGPAAYYRLDEASGTTAVDSSGSGNNATYVHSPTLGQTGALIGNPNAAVNFNGIDQYVALPSAPFGNYSGSNYALSFETWFNAPAGASGVILSQAGAGTAPGGGAPAGWVPAIHLGTDGKLRASLFWHGDVNARLVSPGATTYNDGNWHHVAVTYANGVETLYIDGAQVGQQAVGEVAYAAAYSYYLGTGYTQYWTGGNGGWHFFKGRLDEATIYQRALSGAEIAQAYAAATSSGAPTTIAAQWCPGGDHAALNDVALDALLAEWSKRRHS